MIHLDLHHWFHLASTSWQQFNTKCPCQCGKKHRGATKCLTTKGSSSHLVFLHSTHHVTSCHMFWHRGIYWFVDRKPLTFSCCASVRAGLLTHSWWFVQKSVIFAHSGGSLVAPWHRAKVLTTAWTSNWVWFVRLFISACQLLTKLGDGLCVLVLPQEFQTLIYSIPVCDAIRIGLKMTMENSLFPSIYTDLYMKFNEFHTPTGLSQARLPGCFWLVAADLSPLCICGLWQKLRGETTSLRRQ